MAKGSKNLPSKWLNSGSEPGSKISDKKKRGGFIKVIGPEVIQKLDRGDSYVSGRAKVIGSEIMRKLDRGENYVDVIVLLKGYKDFKGKINADKPAHMAKMQSNIRGLQRIVLNKMTPPRFKLKHKFENIPGFSASITREGLEVLEAMPEVEVIEEDKIAQAHLAQGIPLMNASVLRSGYGGTGVSVAVVDTGIDYTHSMLGGGGFPNSKVIGGYDFGDYDSDPMDCEGHGTSVAGISAGTLASGPGSFIGGVAHNAKLYALKIVSGCGDSASFSTIAAAWDWAVSHKNDDPLNPILVINTSFGGGQYSSACDSSQPTLAMAANNAVANGISLFCSSGNDGFANSIGSPACVSSAISVGAVYDANIGSRTWCLNSGCSVTCTDSPTLTDLVTCYSNSADFLDILASSNDAYTTAVGGGYTSSFGGTSAASPYAAGAAAVIQSYIYSSAGYFFSPTKLEARLKNSGDPIFDTKSGFSKPRVNIGDDVAGKLYKGAYQTKFFNETDLVDIEAFLLDDGIVSSGALLTAELIFSGSVVEVLDLTDVGGGYYQNYWDSTGATPGVYSVDITVAGASVVTQKFFHLYPQSGVSAYMMDCDEDGNDDYVLENVHLVAAYDGRPDRDRSLIYLGQKDTDVDYEFGEVFSAGFKGTGEVANTDMKELLFSSYLFSSQGENMASATLNTEAAIAPKLISAYDSSNGASFDGNYIIDAAQWIAEEIDANDLDKDYVLEKVSIHISNNSGGTYPLVVEIRSDSGNLPGNTVLTSESIAKSSIPAGPDWHEVVFTSPITLSSGGKYWLVVRSDEPDAPQPSNSYGYTWTLDVTGPSYPGFLAYSSGQGAAWASGGSNFDGLFRAYGVTTSFEFSVQMRAETVDYLVYKLSDINGSIDVISDIFSPISGSLGQSAGDDRYHFGNGADDLISSLTPDTWTGTGSLTDSQKYIAIYDDSIASDAVDDNVISLVYMPNANTLDFMDAGAWNGTDREALRIRYDTAGGTSVSEVEYLLAFTQGDYTTVEQWMSNIAGGSYPAPNFMSAPTGLGVSVNPNTWPIGIITPGEIIQTTESDDILVSNSGSVNETFTLKITPGGSSWSPGTSSGVDTYVLKGLFCGPADAPSASLFDSNDIISSGSPVTATGSQFGDSSLSDNGVNLAPGGAVDLWFQFQAPSSTADTSQQSITVTVGAEQSP